MTNDSNDTPQRTEASPEVRGVRCSAAPQIVVLIDRSRCVGNGACIDAAPDVFDHDADGLSILIGPPGDHCSAVLSAALGCPVSAIRVEQIDGPSRVTLFPPNQEHE